MVNKSFIVLHFSITKGDMLYMIKINFDNSQTNNDWIFGHENFVTFLKNPIPYTTFGRKLTLTTYKKDINQGVLVS